jgi:hypothetical protein
LIVTAETKEVEGIDGGGLRLEAKDIRCMVTGPADR